MHAKCICFYLHAFYCILFTYYLLAFLLPKFLRTCDSVRLIELATPFSFDQNYGRQTALTSVWFTTRHGASSSSKFISHGCMTVMNWSNTSWVSGFDIDNDISDAAVDERQDHFQSCIRANYRWLCNWCDSSNIHLANMTCHVSFLPPTVKMIFKLYLL